MGLGITLFYVGGWVGSVAESIAWDLFNKIKNNFLQIILKKFPLTIEAYKKDV